MGLVEIPPKLRWACRRGMLELDVLLGNFLTEAFPAANSDDRASFVRVLDNNDQDLFTWLTGQVEAPDTDTAQIVRKIRQHAQTRHSA
jgi:antitoxin CptB